MALTKIKEHTHSKNDKILFYKNFIIYYDNYEATLCTLHEIFQTQPYNFTTSKRNPFIIDGGANIGLATLFFKEQYPQARIICFEPDPNAFANLKRNVAINRLKDVTLLNAALAKEEGNADFFGQIHVDSPDARGNSILETWGLQRTVSDTIQVKAVKLSSYIDKEVDLLKLDIEGAEQQVLEEIEDKLTFVKQLVMEIHHSERIKHVNSRNKILAILENHQFSYELFEQNIESLLPDPVREWANRVKPHLFTLKAQKCH